MAVDVYTTDAFTAHVPTQEFLSKAFCQQLLDRVVALSSGGGQCFVTVDRRWAGTTHWSRNHIRLAADVQTTDVLIRRTILDRDAEVRLTRLDEEGLREAVQRAEWMLQWHIGRGWPADPADMAPMTEPNLWSAPTFAVSAAARASMARQMAEQAVARNVSSTGMLTLAARGLGAMGTNGTFRHYSTTNVECTMTARDGRRRASGWAGSNHYDLSRIDPLAIAQTALEKCEQSANPVAIEPGRYTVILEPQAVHDLFAPVIDDAMGRATAEAGYGPFAGAWAESASKIGTQVVDARFMLSADPLDPEAGFLPFDETDGAPYRAVTWIDRGYLRELAYNRAYAVRNLGHDRSLPNSRSFRLTAAPGVTVASLENMIASTERGILVSRFSNVSMVDFTSMLCTGYTRDGIWLIERGKITKPLTNFRFTESPLHIMNRVAAIGTPMRAYAPDRARIVPALKVDDFNFSSLADAV